MNVTIKTISAREHRYATLGDWWFTAEGDLEIRTTATGDWRSDMLVALHEFVEVLLCKHDGVSQKEVDAFDIAHPESDEPGDEPDAPYRRQHCIAQGIERIVAAALDVGWHDHGERLEQALAPHLTYLQAKAEGQS